MREPFTPFVQDNLEPEIILITCGLPASAKSGIAEEVQRITGYPIISTDWLRHDVLKGEDVFDPDVASDPAKRRKVYAEVFRRANRAAAREKGVIIDATFITQALRRQAAEIAAKNNRPFVIMQTVCPQEVCLARIARRTRSGRESNAITEQAYFDNKARFEEVDLDDLKRLHPNLNILHCLVDTQNDSPGNWYVIDTRRK